MKYMLGWHLQPGDTARLGRFNGRQLVVPGALQLTQNADMVEQDALKALRCTWERCTGGSSHS